MQIIKSYSIVRISVLKLLKDTNWFSRVSFEESSNLKVQHIQKQFYLN